MKNQENAPMRYLIRATSGKGDAELLDQAGTPAASIQYEGWMSNRAWGKAGGQDFEIRPKNKWWSGFYILVNGDLTGEITFNWKLDAIIRMPGFQQQECAYRLKPSGFFTQRLVLEDEIKDSILTLTPKLRWFAMYFDYQVRLQETQYLETPVELMLMICTYAANIMQRRKSLAASGGA